MITRIGHATVARRHLLDQATIWRITHVRLWLEPSTCYFCMHLVRQNFSLERRKKKEKKASWCTLRAPAAPSTMAAIWRPPWFIFIFFLFFFPLFYFFLPSLYYMAIKKLSKHPKKKNSTDENSLSVFNLPIDLYHIHVSTRPNMSYIILKRIYQLNDNHYLSSYVSWCQRLEQATIWRITKFKISASRITHAST